MDRTDVLLERAREAAIAAGRLLSALLDVAANATPGFDRLASQHPRHRRHPHRLPNHPPHLTPERTMQQFAKIALCGLRRP